MGPKARERSPIQCRAKLILERCCKPSHRSPLGSVLSLTCVNRTPSSVHARGRLLPQLVGSYIQAAKLGDAARMGLNNCSLVRKSLRRMYLRITPHWSCSNSRLTEGPRAVVVRGLISEGGRVFVAAAQRLCKSMNTALGPKSIALSTNRVMLTDDPPWLILKLVGEVKFTEWTSEFEMRHPVFLGLRTDKRHSTSSGCRSHCHG